MKPSPYFQSEKSSKSTEIDGGMSSATSSPESGFMGEADTLRGFADMCRVFTGLKDTFLRRLSLVVVKVVDGEIEDMIGW